jgi:hypothetical protein
MSIIRLTTCYNIIEANMLKDVLENENIECFLTNENFTTLMPGFNGMLGAGIQIMIEEENYDKAYNLIEKNDSEAILCPNCNSANISIGLGRNKFKKITIAILSALIGTPLGNLGSTYCCKNCQTEFKTKLNSP